MQAAPARYVSVSELYSTDEVELLLDEIRELEPASCCAEDIQDFEIAGSQSGTGGRSPVGTERSWDSHAHYRRAPPPRPVPLAPLYCHLAHLLTASGLLRLLLIVCCVSACVCVWCVVGLRAWLVPLPGRVRLLQLAALASALLHAAPLLLHVTRLHRLLPLQWSTLGAALGAGSAGALSVAGALLLHALLAAPEYRRAPHHVAAPLRAAAGLALAGAGVAALLAALEARRGWRGWRGARSAGAPSAAAGAAAGAYRAVPCLPDHDDNPL